MPERQLAETQSTQVFPHQSLAVLENGLTLEILHLRTLLKDTIGLWDDEIRQRVAPEKHESYLPGL